MFSLFRKSPPRRPSAAVSDALVVDGLQARVHPDTLAAVEQSGAYAGRRVKYFRVFDPIRSAERGLTVHGFRDLDGHADLVIGSGHVEAGGGVVLYKSERPPTPSTPERSSADRSAHADDEQFVFHTATRAPQADDRTVDGQI